MTSTTQRYTRTHRALLDAARTGGVGILAIRALLAVAEAGGETSTSVIYASLGATYGSSDGANVRKALAELYDKGLATGTPAHRPTAPITVTLTPEGQAVARGLLKRAEGKAP